MKPPQKNQVICGSNLEITKPWSSNCIDAICTDPPYGLGFMGKEWDTFKPEEINRKTKYSTRKEKRNSSDGMASRSGIRYDESLSGHKGFQQWFTVWAKAMLRITKPGGFLLCFGGTRTYHRLTCAIEDAGWEIRDCMMWLYGSGFPKSHNISKAIDKKAGAKRKVIGKRTLKGNAAVSCKEKGGTYVADASFTGVLDIDVTIPATELAQLWDGYGTALKPAWEPIIVAMKPLDGTFAHNAEAHGVAGLNIDGGRIETTDKYSYKKCGGSSFSVGKGIDGTREYPKESHSQGRWPANLILDEEAGGMLDEQSGNRKGWTGQFHNEFNPYGGNALQKSKTTREGKHEGYKDSGGASRFFYCAKCSKKERNLGLEDRSGKKVNDGRQTPIDNPYQRGETIRSNTHPTVKPLALMKYLGTLLKMPSAEQIILDPFLGSGTTGMACRELGINFIGIEKEPEYCEIAVRRIAAVEGIHPVVLHTETIPAEVPEITPCHDEHRQRIINAASAELRRNRK